MEIERGACPSADRVLAMKPITSVVYSIGLLAAMLSNPLATHGQENPATQTETDEYTSYELLAPESASFAIRYEVTATTPGATVYFNPIRKGSVASDESVRDVMSGEALKFEIVSGMEAVKDPLLRGEDADVDYIKVHLARPVPPQGQARLLILKTYRDRKSYYREGDTVVFNRQLSIPRNKVILYAGYEVVACNVPSQVLTEPDGRISVSFMNGSGTEAPLIVKTRRGAETVAPPKSADRTHRSGPPPEAWPGTWQLAERAHSDQQTVLLLQQPETHSYQQVFDYTTDPETTMAYGLYGKTEVTGVSAYVLDTGEELQAKVLTRAEAEKTTGELREVLADYTHFVVISPPASQSRQSLRIRVVETVTEPAALRVIDQELVFESALKSARNAVVLPRGWYVTATSHPATVSQMQDGRIRLDFWNGGPAPVEVLVKARRRVAAGG